MIFDTSIWVGLAAGQISGQAVHQATGDESVYISAISLGELNLWRRILQRSIETDVADALFAQL
jgi:predicted nucleic acid-binding protein